MKVPLGENSKVSWELSERSGLFLLTFDQEPKNVEGESLRGEERG